MNRIEVDPKLFITCRLCLDELGMYQIVPSVQKQIKFCFDIDVSLFDGLPQLLCKKCEEILRDFTQKKKMFQEKNAALLEQIKGNEPQGKQNLESVIKQFHNSEVEEVVTSSQINEESTDVDNVSNSCNAKKRPSRTYKNQKWWLKAGFCKQYQCRLCSKSFTIKSSITNHIRSHEKLTQKYQDIYSRWCNVSIEKFDDKPNKTGSLKTVVRDDHMVLQNVHNKNYYIKFVPIQTNGDNNSNDSNSEEVTFKGNTSKRRRITSRDSTDTVVLGNSVPKTNNSDTEIEKNIEEKAPVDTECISINDSSDNESIESHESSRKDETQNQAPDYKTILSIISVCHQKYLKKIESQESDSSSKKKKPANVENLLKHKILSIGRKIINKQSFNCNGILRFMDHKNLNIEWKPIKQSQDKKHIRILTQQKRAKKNITDTYGWKNMSQFIEKHKDFIKQSPNNDIQTKSSSHSNGHSKTNVTYDIQCDEASTAVPQDAAVLYVDIDGQNESKKIILNENPVANPKQLPKKMAELKGKKHDQQSIEVSVYDSNEIIATLQQDKNVTQQTLPIITSTTSLAQITVESDIDTNAQSIVKASKVANIQPRIKVKPVSELMAPKTWYSHNNNNSNNINMPVRVTGTVPQYFITVHNPVSIPVFQQDIAQTSQANSDMIMLHTVELPHCKTDTPFRYFQNLLQIHSIILLDCNAILDINFMCLIKFKVHYAEGAKDRPIVLCSSLMYSNNNFCIKIRDSKQLEIDITKLSANWQWEIMKTFTSDVATKMLVNALKFGRDVHAKTNDFIRLLKSIEMQKINRNVN